MDDSIAEVRSQIAEGKPDFRLVRLLFNLILAAAYPARAPFGF
jgi:hypothetical protein